jgi:hypothetical protein
MPNLYKRTLGKRKYHDFSKEDLEKALREIRSKKNVNGGSGRAL